jgi:hypothetical protein
MFKSHAKMAFRLTEQEILTLPHESIPGSFKTYYAFHAVKALHSRKFIAGALADRELKGNLRMLRATTDTGRRCKANFYEFYYGDSDRDRYERMWGSKGRVVRPKRQTIQPSLE